MEDLHWFPLAGGWFALSESGIFGRQFVRFADDKGRLVVSGVLLSGAHGLAGSLRSFPVARLEAIANDPSQAVVIRESIATPAVDPVEQMMATLSLSTYATPWESLSGVASVDEADATIRVPGQRPYPSEFYDTVAAVYRAHAAHANNPAGRIAEAANVPVKTVHGWIAECRRRGLLAPGRAGRAG
jgi:hypothetical protein